MSRPVFGVDRVPDPWQPTWEDGSLFTSEELRELEEAEASAIALHASLTQARELGADDPIVVRGADGTVIAALNDPAAPGEPPKPPWRIMPRLRRQPIEIDDEGMF